MVDDEEQVRELLRDILESEGYKVSVAAGGREALSLFDANYFDAVFTDVGMPGMSGWELARAIREGIGHDGRTLFPWPSSRGGAMPSALMNR